MGEAHSVFVPVDMYLSPNRCLPQALIQACQTSPLTSFAISAELAYRILRSLFSSMLIFRET